MESRGQKHHRERLGLALKEEISTILAGELRDPRIGLVTVTDVVMQPGGKSVRIYVTVLGDEREAEQTLEGLRGAVGYIRHELAENLGLRVAPDLSFQLDRSEQYGGRIDELLTRVQKRSRKNAPPKEDQE